MIYTRLPKRIVLLLLQKYEDLDINLLVDAKYQEKKTALLNKRVIRLEDIRNFIEDTKNSEYTKFMIIPSSVMCHLIQMYYKRANKVFYYDVKFKNILYLRLRTFTMDCCEEIEEVIINTALKEIIIDLRDNSGGVLKACLHLIDLFLPEKKYMTLITKNDIKSIESSSRYKDFCKIYIFLNENSASCSEIISLVLRKNLDNVVLIGNKTVGKYCTQHSIRNKYYGYLFAIEDSKWMVGKETVKDLEYYIRKDSNEIHYSSVNEYYNRVLKIREESNNN